MPRVAFFLHPQALITQRHHAGRNAANCRWSGPGPAPEFELQSRGSDCDGGWSPDTSLRSHVDRCRLSVFGAGRCRPPLSCRLCSGIRFRPSKNATRFSLICASCRPVRSWCAVPERAPFSPPKRACCPASRQPLTGSTWTRSRAATRTPTSISRGTT